MGQILPVGQRLSNTVKGQGIFYLDNTSALFMTVWMSHLHLSSTGILRLNHPMIVSVIYYVKDLFGKE